MILCHPEIETIIDFSQSKVPTVVIENPDFFRKFLLDLYEQKSGNAGACVLSDNGKTLEISKWVEIIDNCLTFELNSKSLLTKISSAMEKTAISESFYLKTADLLQRMEQFLNDLAFTFDCDIICNRCNAAAIIKAVGFSLRDEYEDPLERLVDYMELIREFQKDSLFIFVNLRCYFPDEKISLFLDMILAHSYKVLLIDCLDRVKFPSENRITIDADLCEF